MWIFLVTEILVFRRTLIHHQPPRVSNRFGIAGNMLDLNLGFANTVGAHRQQLTMAMSSGPRRPARKTIRHNLSHPHAAPWLVFLGVKVVR